MWPRNDVIDLLGIEHPIFQAPMGGESTPALATAVSNAGGLGGVGCSFMTLDEIRETASTLRAGTNRAFNLNFFAHPEPVVDEAAESATRERVAPFYTELGLGEPPDTGSPSCDPFDGAKLEMLLDIRPPVVSFHFGLPDVAMVWALQDAGSVIVCSATTVAEAVQLADAGIDIIIAQGWEAGGHRGTFHVSPDDFGVGTMALVPQIVDAVDVPVIAAGGIADGRGIAAAFALGASGVQMGTAFLSCPEAAISDRHRDVLRDATDSETRLSLAYSGRPARMLNSRYVAEMAESRAPMPDFPRMTGFSKPLIAAGEDQNNPDFDVLLYGQAAALNREMPASDLMARLIEEARAILNRP